MGDRLSVSILDQGTGFDHKSMLEAVKAKNAAQAARERYQPAASAAWASS